MPEFSMYRTPDGKTHLRVMRFVPDPKYPNPSWFRRFFGFPYVLEQVGTVELDTYKEAEWKATHRC
jgi:hypothetical protein